MNAIKGKIFKKKIWICTTRKMRNLVIAKVSNNVLAVGVGVFPGAVTDEDEFFISVYGGSTNPVFKFRPGESRSQKRQGAFCTS